MSSTRKNFNFASGVARVLTFAILALLVGPLSAVAAPLTYTSNQTVSLSSPAINFTIVASSTADTLVVNATSVVVTLSSSTGGNFVLTSASRDLSIASSSVGGTANQSCVSGVASTTIAQTTGSTSYTISPTAAQCVTPSPPPPPPAPASGGGGGGGGGGYSYSFQINNGASMTTSGVVTLSINAGGASDMMISENSNFSDTTWIPYASQYNLTLSPGTGTKIVYVRVRGSYLGIPPAVSQSITLTGSIASATTTPSVSTTTLSVSTTTQPSISPAVLVSGVAKLDDGTPIDALVWAWSDRGGSISLRAGQDGKFLFSLTRDGQWHIGASRDVNGFSYKYSDGFYIGQNTADFSVTAVLAKQNLQPLPLPATITQSAAATIIVAAQDGATINVPAGAAVSQGTVTATIRPTSEAPSQLTSYVAGTVYDITLKDQSGSSIKTLTQAMDITLPYKDDDLKRLGTNADSVYPSYFDDANAVWVKIDSFTIDKIKKVFIAHVTHLTRFAIIAAADITPPDAPTQIGVRALKSGIELAWLNPASDFDHAKIYRSEKIGDFGKLIANDISGQKFIDYGVAGGGVYYYLVRAVDPAGNESTNKDQLAIKAAVGLKTGKLTKNLKLGSRGDDVFVLQLFLINQNTGPLARKLATFGANGRFGPLTKKALQEFQKSAGITATGYLGSKTRAYINSLK